MEYLAFEEYRNEATERAKKNFIDLPTGYEIDHLLCIRDAYEKGIPVDLISHPANLRLLTTEQKRKKGEKSEIGEFELCAKISEHRKAKERSGDGF